MAESTAPVAPLHQLSPSKASFLDARIHNVATVQLPQPAVVPSPLKPAPAPTATQSLPSLPLLPLLPPPASYAIEPVLRHKSSQTWHHGGRSPRLSPANSPRGLRARHNSSPMQPISLPVSISSTSSTSTSSTTSTTSTTSNTNSNSNSNSNSSGGSGGDAMAGDSVKQPSLMRRVSQKAANKLRRRTSSASRDQDERSGPVLMRNRSGSTSGDGSRLGIQHHDSLDDDDESIIVVLGQVDGPHGLNTATAADRGRSVTVPGQQQADTNVGIVVPEELQRGTAMTRVTRKKKVQRLFKLDVNMARVSWDSSKPSSRFCVDDMKEVRTGANARNYREELQISSNEEDRWITIIYIDPEESNKLKLLHVITPTTELFKLWTSTLEAINRYRTEMMAGLAMQGEKFVDAHWRNYMANQQASSPQPVKDDRLAFEDVERLCRRLHVNCSRRFLKEKFKRADRDNSGYLNFQEFQRFVKLLKERDEIKEMWEDLVVNPSAGMYRNEFRAFLREVQKVDVDADSTQVDKVFRKFCRQSSKLNRVEGSSHLQIEDIHDMRMSREAFAAFLLSSSYNPPLLHATIEHNLDRPLNEYYCSSSHNTYLMGRQVRGESSVEGYIRVLQRGCRCVEIDCWDGDDGRPVVTHGHTGTSQCLFSDVISAISKYAFVASPYPVILSLEVHCSLEQQVKMADHLIAILGERLVTEPYMTNSLILPSPQDLKHRIIVKVKGSERKESSLLKSDIDSIERKSGNASPRGQGFFRANSSSGTGSTTSESDDPSSGSGEHKKKPPKVATKIAYDLGRLGVYCRGQKFRNFGLPESKTYNHVFSFQEKSFLKFCKDPEKKLQMEKHNIRYLMRVYPSGFRVNSSNFDPLGFWRRGVQMVALNWQTYDLGIQLNEAMFASANDSSGYVLKPRALRGSRTTFDPSADAADAKLKKDKKRVAFSIEVVSAQQLPRPKDLKPDESIDPFVEVEVFSADDKSKGTSTGEGGIDLSDSKGISGLGAPQKRRTKVVRDDGFHPLFKEKMKFSLITKFEDLVFVRFSVFNSEGADDKALIATYTAKLISLQQGYRHLPLYDIQGEQYLFSTLFVKVDVNPMTIIDRETAPRASTTIESFKTTAKSVLSRGFSSDRRSVKRKEVQNRGDEKLAVKDTGKIVTASPSSSSGSQGPHV